MEAIERIKFPDEMKEEDKKNLRKLEKQ